MECTLAALIACFSWSGIYVDSGLEFQDGREQHAVLDRVWFEGREIWSYNYEWSYNRNPYGRFGIGYQVSIGSVTWSLDAKHVSSLDTTSDRGINSLSIGMRWHPFR